MRMPGAGPARASARRGSRRCPSVRPTKCRSRIRTAPRAIFLPLSTEHQYSLPPMSKTSSQTRAATALVPQLGVKRRRPPVVGPLGRPAPEPSALVRLADELGALIDAAEQEDAMTAASALTTLHWRIGRRVRSEILGARRQQFGAGIVVALGAELARRYGRGYGEAALRQMIRFAEAYPEPDFASELGRRLSWHHFKDLLVVADPLRRGYFAAMKGELTP